MVLTISKNIQDGHNMLDSAEEARTFYGPLHMDAPVLADQQVLIYISSVRTQDVVRKTCLTDRDGWREK